MTSDGEITITWLGHATVLIDTAGGKRILIDPWVQNNPSTPDEKKSIDRLDLMLISHGHFDHMQDAVQIAQQTQPDIISNFEICAYLESKGVQKCSGMNIGGTQRWQNVDVTMVEAIHSSGISDGSTIIYGGTACGYVLRFGDGFTVYHSGDTAVFESMKLIGHLYDPDVALLPIGSHFTMGPREAAEAVRLLEVPCVIPIHHGTFPLLTGTPDAFRNETRDISALKVIPLKQGESVRQSDIV